MKSFIATLFVVLFFNFNFDQLNCNSYFALINEAENYIISCEYNKAVMFYEKIFAKYNSPHGNDYYNAALASLFTKNDSLAFIFFKESVKRGYTLDFLSNPIVQKRITNKTEWNLFKESYDSLHYYYVNKLNTPVITEFKNMIVEDQLLTNKIYFGNASQEQLDSMYYKNMNRVVELIKKDSIPKVEYFDMKSRKLQSIIPFIVLRHYFGMLNRAIYNPELFQGDFYDHVLKNNHYIEEELLKLISQGKLSPVLISESLTYNNPNDLFGRLGQSYGRYITNEKNEDILVEYVTTREDYTAEEIEIININRQKWHLPDFNSALNMTKELEQVPDSIYSHFSKYFNLTGRITANEFFITEFDSIEFIQDCEKNLIQKLGYKLDWTYLGIEKGWKLPK